MKLSGLKIKSEIEHRRITCIPFNPEHLGPNSLDLTLNEKLLVYKHHDLKADEENETVELLIPEGGKWLYPGIVYLGSTNEFIGSNAYIPGLEGRSSVGRLGISIHTSAGFGDIGFHGHWTLEITVTQPIIVKANMRICQMFFDTIDGPFELYDGKYNQNDGVQASMMYKDVTKADKNNRIINSFSILGTSYDSVQANMMCKGIGNIDKGSMHLGPWDTGKEPVELLEIEPEGPMFVRGFDKNGNYIQGFPDKETSHTIQEFSFSSREEVSYAYQCIKNLIYQLGYISVEDVMSICGFKNVDSAYKDMVYKDESIFKIKVEEQNKNYELHIMGVPTGKE